MTDAQWMDRALALARTVEGLTSPRPPVGALVVAGGRVVGEGSTTASPGPHAEVVALRQAGEGARGATVYVTLEPCGHTGATGPCAEALAAAGVARVVAAMRDPNPAVRGRGLRTLRSAGVEVRTGVRRAQAARLIEPFATWVKLGRPHVTLKMASSLDGKVAAADGSSRWITGPAARSQVHEMRSRADAVVVGAGTVEADDPSLTCRMPGHGGRQPLRVVLDSSGRTRPDAKVFDGRAPLLVVTTTHVPAGRLEEWRAVGADVQVVEAAEAGVSLPHAMRSMGERGVCSVLCEGGPTLAASLLHEGFVDRLVVYCAPLLIGGDAAGVLSVGAKTLTDATRLRIERVSRVGPDLRVDAVVEGC
ncbi:MAG TPA: bifunctional diaminohydroxyphosphoribosylaminopyrimidine deaminase/5-amino-6-(5-phosphoribosylamino)uracil reductase RibD [Actinomycetota bacterium]|nr:bifunctional diaminohydroxyphosphoribosylaminopyrimidine deaminase/5-amino-6-(5-phosphoribosylamino)uracil reductase RibD [Actinomycetota bacterium]